MTSRRHTRSCAEPITPIKEEMRRPLRSSRRPMRRSVMTRPDQCMISTVRRVSRKAAAAEETIS
jgi:hypothetical protein